MRLAAYLRVSTDDQRTALQRDAIARHAAGQGHDVVAWYEDQGVSGAERRRPQLDALRAEFPRRRFDGVIVWRLDRAARSVRHLIDLLEELRGHRLAFVSVTEALDTTTPAGLLLFHVIAALAQFERDLIAERVKAGMATARVRGTRSGKAIGRPRRDVDVDVARRWLAKGHSLIAVARRLGVPEATMRRRVKIAGLPPG